MHPRTTKRISLILVAMLLGTLVSACGATPAASPAATTAAAAATTASAAAESTAASTEAAAASAVDLTGTEVTFWNGFTASDGDVLRDIYNRYNESNGKGITVKMDIMPWANMLEKLAPAIATGTGPSMILLGSETIPEYAASGGLIKMDDFWTISGLDKSIYAQNVQDTFVYQDAIYGIPMQYNTQYLYWNKDLFKEAGLDPEQPPKTFTQLKEYAAKITDKSKERYGFGIATGSSNITNFLWSNGGDWLTADQGKAACDTPEMIEVLSMLQNFAKNGDTPVGMSGADMDNLLYAGRLGMYINGPWLINGLRTQGVNFGIGGVPGSDSGKLQVPGGGVAWMVTSSATENQKLAAYDCISHWLSKDVLKEWTMKNGFAAWSTEVLADADVQADPIQKVLGPLSSFGRLPFAGMPEYGQITNDSLNPLFEQLMYEKVTPEDCAKQMAEGIDAVLMK